MKKYNELLLEWETSLHEEDLVKTIREKIFPQDIFIDSALCLGLGRIGEARNRSLPGKLNLSFLQRSKMTWEDQCDAEQKNLDLIARGERNWGLYQLIVFETVLHTLREKFTIDIVQFQDPRFTSIDEKFLEQKSYTIAPYPADRPLVDYGNWIPLDHNILSFASSSTFFFAPYLDRPVVVEAICAVKPELYLGNDLLADIYNPILTRHQTSTYHRMKTF